MYNAVEGAYAKLLHEGKGNTRAGIGFKGEMDYWWSKLTAEERHELVVAAKEELEEMFSKPFAEEKI